MSYTKDSLEIYRPSIPVIHRSSEYNEIHFEILSKMQHDHFWYLGRHKFIFQFLKKFAYSFDFNSMVDLGGGVGGWIKYLQKRFNEKALYRPDKKMRLALADSSEVALRGARQVLSSEVEFYQVDLMNLEWENEWDVAFLLDVIEHCPDDIQIVKEATKALRSGGLLLVTAPALDFFWSSNDVAANHLRRYNKERLRYLATEADLQLMDCKYFMFFLSPLYWFSRKVKSKNLSPEQLKQAIEKEHNVPSYLINKSFELIFSLETPIGCHIPFPWGTSILGVFQKK